MRVWDTRSGSKTLKLKGHTDNIRALLLDSSGRFVEWTSNFSCIFSIDIYILKSALAFSPLFIYDFSIIIKLPLSLL